MMVRYRQLRRCRLVGHLVVLALAIMACATVAACGGVSYGVQGSPSATPPGSGIEGVTEAGPQCPIVIPGSPCPDKPVSKTIAVLDAQGHEVARFTSAADGTFRVGLAPGRYTLTEVVSPPGAPPSLKPVSVTVPPGQFIHVVLAFDTGIR